MTGAKDSNGAVLWDGDSATLIKDLKVKGTSETLKCGTLVKNIRLTVRAGEIGCNTKRVKGPCPQDRLPEEGLSPAPIGGAWASPHPVGLKNSSIHQLLGRERDQGAGSAVPGQGGVLPDAGASGAHPGP
ncbi:PhnA domain-containing protein [Streptomyces sp.]